MLPSVLWHFSCAATVFGNVLLQGFPAYIWLIEHERGSCMVREINMGVCPRLDFENIMLFNCLGYNFNIYGAFEFLCNSIANL